MNKFIRVNLEYLDNFWELNFSELQTRINFVQ